MDRTTLCNLIDSRKEELYDLLCKLIRINSENFGAYGNEQACPAYIRDLCLELGMETEMYSPLDIPGYREHPDYLDGRHLENRYNVSAIWRGKTDENELMLMGHSDTVEIGDRQMWSFEPLLGEVRDGKIWGRGACDDKYALATALFLIKLLKEQGFTPKKNLVFSAYCDEERGGSNGALTAVLRDPCKRVVNMDCKNFEIWQCASGGGNLTYRFHTEKPVDSAVHAAKAMNVVMEVLERFAANRREELSRNPFYQDTIIPGTSFRYMGIHAGNDGADLGVGRLKVTFYTDKTKEEIFAELAELEEVLKERLTPMGVISDGFGLSTRFFHYTYTDPNNASILDMCEAAREVSGRELNVCASCLSDLSVILKYGSPDAYGFGIGRDFNAYGGAHQPDEFIECDKLVEYAKIIGTYILKTLGE